jgi:hypothetical protein
MELGAESDEAQLARAYLLAILPLVAVDGGELPRVLIRSSAGDKLVSLSDATGRLAGLSKPLQCMPTRDGDTVNLDCGVRDKGADLKAMVHFVLEGIGDLAPDAMDHSLIQLSSTAGDIVLSRRLVARLFEDYDFGHLELGVRPPDEAALRNGAVALVVFKKPYPVRIDIKKRQ